MSKRFTDKKVADGDNNLVIVVLELNRMSEGGGW